MGLVLITHDLRVAFSVCSRIYVLYAGSVLETAPAAELESEPLHPYSLGLLASDPPVGYRVSPLPVIDGSVPSPDEVGRVPLLAPLWLGCPGMSLGTSPPGRRRPGKAVCLRASGGHRPGTGQPTP